MEVVRAKEPVGRLLLDVAVAVDSARQHELAGGVDLFPAFAEIQRQRRDQAVADAGIGGEGVGGGDDGAAANDEVERVHGESSGCA